MKSQPLSNFETIFRKSSRYILSLDLPHHEISRESSVYTTNCALSTRSVLA